jgi:hypothetical protein
MSDTPVPEIVTEHLAELEAFGAGAAACLALGQFSHGLAVNGPEEFPRVVVAISELAQTEIDGVCLG